MTRSWRCNIADELITFVGNEIQQRHRCVYDHISDKVVSQRQREWISYLWFNDDIRGMHRGRHIFPGIPDDHWWAECLDHVWSVPEP